MSATSTERAPLPEREQGSDAGVRLRLLECRLDRRPAAISRVRVELSGLRAGDRVSGEREGAMCPAGDLRLAALATIDAMGQATAGELVVELIGVKPVRAFDSMLVVVAVLIRHAAGTTRVVGAAMADDDLLRATVRATLDAINRQASPILARLQAQH